MKLTEEQQKKSIDKLQEFFAHSCECSGHDWILNDRIFELRDFQGGGITIGGQSTIFPVIVVTCKQCGRTHFFNAIILGLIEK